MLRSPPDKFYRLLMFQLETQDNFNYLYAFSQFLFVKNGYYNVIKFYTFVSTLLVTFYRCFIYYNFCHCLLIHNWF